MMFKWLHALFSDYFIFGVSEYRLPVQCLTSIPTMNLRASIRGSKVRRYMDLKSSGPGGLRSHDNWLRRLVLSF
jgi:hypothetical protein